MKKTRFLIILTGFLCLAWSAYAQIDTLPMKIIQSKEMVFGVADFDLIDELMPTMPGLGSTSRDMLNEQSVKAYMMPPRRMGSKSTADSYAIAFCLEFYVNFDKNYKVNLSPEFIELNLGEDNRYTLKEAFIFLASTGTVSAAIMPYESLTIPAGVFATPKYKIANYLHIFRPEMKDRQKIFETKKALMRGNPLLIEMQIPKNFQDLKDTKFWSPKNNSPTQIHPFVVVGFDENLEAFEVLSSWGSSWGRNGYLWIKYDDFARFATNGYVIVPDEY